MGGRPHRRELQLEDLHPRLITVKMGSRPHLSLSSGASSTTLYTSGTRWSGFWDDWVPSNAVARIEKLQGSTWVNVAHKTLYHGHATITVPGHGTYRELILETDGVWGSHFTPRRASRPNDEKARGAGGVVGPLSAEPGLGSLSAIELQLDHALLLTFADGPRWSATPTIVGL
jgi:hypothetical protein